MNYFWILITIKSLFHIPHTHQSHAHPNNTLNCSTLALERNPPVLGVTFSTDLALFPTLLSPSPYCIYRIPRIITHIPTFSKLLLVPTGESEIKYYLSLILYHSYPKLHPPHHHGYVSKFYWLCNQFQGFKSSPPDRDKIIKLPLTLNNYPLSTSLIFLLVPEIPSWKGMTKLRLRLKLSFLRSRNQIIFFIISFVCHVPDWKRSMGTSAPGIGISFWPPPPFFDLPQTVFVQGWY